MDKQRRSIAAKQRAAIAERWTEQALAVYPPNTVRLFLAEKDRFRNPVGEAIRRNLTLLLDTVLSDQSLDQAAEALDEIIRIRSVQELVGRGCHPFRAGTETDRARNRSLER